jgi:hypothetical protein
MLREYLQGLTLLTIGLVLVASLIGLARYRRLPTNLRYLTLLACFEVLTDLTAKVLDDILDIRNLFLIPFISIGELTLLMLAYRQVLQSVAFNKALPWLLGLFSLYALFISFSQLGIVRHAIDLEIIVDLLMLGLAGLYFRKLLDELQIKKLRYDPFFWVSAGLAVYGLGSLLISLFSNYLLTHCSVQLQLIVLWGVRNLFNITLYASYCVALWLRPQKDRPEPVATSTLPRA